MKESQLKTNLCKSMRVLLNPTVVWRLEDQFTANIPDICFTRKGKTHFIEVKHITRKKPYKHNMSQHETIRHLDDIGSGSLYVIFEEDKEGDKWTHVFRPEHMPENIKDLHYQGSSVSSCLGYDYAFVSARIKTEFDNGSTRAEH